MNIGNKPLYKKNNALRLLSLSIIKYCVPRTPNSPELYGGQGNDTLRGKLGADGAIKDVGLVFGQRSDMEIAA